MKSLSIHRKIALAVFVIAGLVWFFTRSGLEKQDAPSTANASQLQSIPVNTAVAVAKEIPIRLNATGSFLADESSEIAPEVSGRVAATPVDVGDFVRKGQVIARLDSRDASLNLQQAQAAVQQAEASLRQAEAKIGATQISAFNPETVPEVQAAKANYESAQAEAKLAEADARRHAGLVETGDISRSAYDQVLTQAATAQARAEAARKQYEAAVNTARQGRHGVATAQAALSSARVEAALARKALADTVIRAPFDGYIAARPVAAGEYVTSATAIATLMRISPLRLELQLPESEANRVRTGMKVTARVAASPQREFTGVVTALNPAINPSGRALAVRAEFPNSDLQLRPGMFAAANIRLNSSENAIFVPREAVQYDPDTNSSYLFVVEGSTARMRVIQTGAEEGGAVRIISGVEKGEVVATGNLEELFDGATLQLQPAQPAPLSPSTAGPGS